MKCKTQFVAILSVIACILSAKASFAQDFYRNAWGFYAAPTIYGYSKGTDYETSESNGGLDLGLTYSRFFTRGFSARLEARYANRALDGYIQFQQFPDVYYSVRLAEKVLEFPLILQADRRVPIADHELRLSSGGGVSYKYVLDRKLFAPGGEVETPLMDGSYQRLSLLLDGGVTFEVAPGDDVFARIRLDVDVATFGEPENAEFIRRFWSTGIYVGYELGF